MTTSVAPGPRTHFAPAGRYHEDELRLQQQIVHGAGLLQPLMDAVSEVVLILNDRRQIVAANAHALELVGRSLEGVLGRRPGEAIGCVHAYDGPDGCTTGRTCLTCGAAKAILISQGPQRRARRQCRVSLANCGAMDLDVTASGIEAQGHLFVACFIQDVSDRNRRRLLERVFFHDVLNAAGSLERLASMLAAECSEQPPAEQDLHLLAEGAGRLIDEIRAQRDLAAAEAGEYERKTQSLPTKRFLDSLIALYSRHPAAARKRIALGEAWDGQVATDERLLARIVGNMLTNALEASEPGATVRVDCADGGEEVTFSVHNDGAMPEEVQLQVFQRSFSTKQGTGRGIGTHSMKLFGEKYLGGTVGFRSDRAEGTTFHVRLPKGRPADHEGGAA